MPDLGGGAQTWDWNGRTGRGTVRNGRYVLQLVGRAGGRTFHAPSSRPTTLAQVAAFGVTVDTVAPTVRAASASTTLISPNGDGNHDAVRLAMTSSGATRWALLVASPAGTIRTAHGSGGSIAFTWRGERDGGARVADGRYTATLGVMDAAGNQARRSFTIVVDTTGPVISTAAAPGLLSPNGDGAQDATRLSWSANERGSGTVRILKGSTVVRSWTVHSVSGWATSWDGRTAGGKRVGDGRYVLRVDLVDAGGNRRAATRTVVVDRTAGFLRWSRNFYPQDADPLAPSSTLSWKLTRDAKTTLRLYNASGALVRTVWTGKAAARGRPPVGVERPARERRLRPAGPVRGAPDGLVVPGHGRPGPPRLGERVRRVDLGHEAEGRPDAAGDVHDARAPWDEAHGLVQAARPGGEGRDGDAAHRRLVRRHVQGAGRRRRHGLDPDLRPRHRRPPEPVDAVGPGRVLSRASEPGPARTLTPR